MLRECFVEDSHDWRARSLRLLLRWRNFLFRCVSLVRTFVGARAGAFVSIAFTITLDLNVGIVFTPFIVAPDTSCSIFLTGTRTIRLHYSNSLQICPKWNQEGRFFSQRRPPDVFGTETSLHSYAQREILTLRVVHHFVTRRTRGSALVSFTRKILSSYDWLLANPLGTPRSVSRSNNNLRGFTYGIRLVWETLRQ